MVDKGSDRRWMYKIIVWKARTIESTKPRAHTETKKVLGSSQSFQLTASL